MLSPTSKFEIEEVIRNYTDPPTHNVPTDVLDDPDIRDSERRDYFGFYHSREFTKEEKIIEQKYRQNDLKRFDKWSKMTSNWDEVDSLWQRMFRNGRASEKLTRRIFKGIPQRFRMIVWPLLLCVPDIKRKHKDMYLRMVKRGLTTSTYLVQIDLDINRTLRNTIYFRSRYGPRQRALFRVLVAYSVYNSEIGYCQGMSDLVGMFLIYIEDEEDAFWALAQLMTGLRHRMHGVYLPNFPGLQRLFDQHERILTKLLPVLDQHFKRHQMLSTTYALKWYMQCFLDRLPVTLVLRIWDIYLLEGEKLLLAMSYNILKMHNKRLLRMDQIQMTTFFQDDLVKDFLFDDDLVIESLKVSIETLRKAKLDNLPSPTPDMLPTLPMGYLPVDSVWRVRSDETTQIPFIRPNLIDSTNRNNNGLFPRRNNRRSNKAVDSSSPDLPTVQSRATSPSGLSGSATVLTLAALKNQRKKRSNNIENPSPDNYIDKPFYRTVGSYHLKQPEVTSTSFSMVKSSTSVNSTFTLVSADQGHRNNDNQIIIFPNDYQAHHVEYTNPKHYPRADTRRSNGFNIIHSPVTPVSCYLISQTDRPSIDHNSNTSVRIIPNQPLDSTYIREPILNLHERTGLEHRIVNGYQIPTRWASVHSLEHYNVNKNGRQSVTIITAKNSTTSNSSLDEFWNPKSMNERSDSIKLYRDPIWIMQPTERLTKVKSGNKNVQIVRMTEANISTSKLSSPTIKPQFFKEESISVRNLRSYSAQPVDIFMPEPKHVVSDA